MPGPHSDSYGGPRDDNPAVPTWMLRGGPGFDYPCADPRITECAMYECQSIGRCRKARAVAPVT